MYFFYKLCKTIFPFIIYYNFFCFIVWRYTEINKNTNELFYNNRYLHLPDLEIFILDYRNVPTNIIINIVSCDWVTILKVSFILTRLIPTMA